MAAARYAAGELPYVDSRRLAVSGVSYGGYVAARVMSDRDATRVKGEEDRDGVGEPLFKCGVAVSPVVDWRFYGE